MTFFFTKEIMWRSMSRKNSKVFQLHSSSRSSGNQSLGITLLIGIVILYITAYFFVFDATDSVRVISRLSGDVIFKSTVIPKNVTTVTRTSRLTTTQDYGIRYVIQVCRSRVVLHGIGYTLCFGVMIAKVGGLLSLAFSHLIVERFEEFLIIGFDYRLLEVVIRGGIL